MRRFGLLGYPLSHSFSQKYFTEKFARLGLTDCVYENFSLPDIAALSDVLQSKKDLRGFNITIPYKKQVLAFVDEVSPVVKAIGACNCVNIKDGKRIGHNTDVVGFEQSLRPFLKAHHTRALVLGTGGASAAVVYVLQQLGIAVQYVSRTASEQAIAYEQVDEALLSSHHLIVNTTPLGMYPNVEECPPLPYQCLTPLHHLYDLIYNPAETRFLANGKARGASVQNGQEMLVLQAEESWRIWNS
ncbi:MAG: shikimate dehydrogenase [Chitinophagaceae bacterium]|nr:shikimate dehydrogenase [Chitinophagaceae bacterium]MCA6457089.1 shikimate dehydrogenase [Chitinophagaceae bacterium]MCA6460601.1 shikimate dehydrogenase [Chitinophagaceae bacterium]MCA6466111.1 shikimate dehydrogenase [Chitinophagaceae bacterium]